MAATTKRHPARIAAPARLRRRRAADRAGVRGRVRHRALRELGTDRGEPGAGARQRPVPRCRTSSRGRRAVHTHSPVSGAFRGFGVPQAAIAAGDARSTGWPTPPASTGWSSASSTRSATATPPPPASCCTRRRHRRLPRGAARRTGARALAEAAAANAGRRPAGAASASPACWYGCGNTATAQSLDHPARPPAGRRPRAAPGRDRHRPGLEHGDRPDRRRRARPAGRRRSRSSAATPR